MTSPWDLVRSGAAGATTAVLAAPYIKENTLLRLLNNASRLVSLTCVTRWSPGDISAGVSDAPARELVVGKGGTFLLHPTLHAKYYRFDDMVLIGSANLTNSGLGLASNSNLEILSPPSDDFDSMAFERLLLSQSRVVSDAEYAVWQSIPVKAQSPVVVPESFILSWRPLTRDPGDLWLVYSDETGNSLPESVVQQAAQDLSAILAPEGLERGAFSMWVSSALLASPFVSDVRSIAVDAEPTAFIQLGQSWDMTPGDARYAAETVHNWLSYYSLEF